MQATFVTLQSVITLDNDILTKGHQTFLTLFTRHFKEVIRVGTIIIIMVWWVKNSFDGSGLPFEFFFMEFSFIDMMPVGAVAASGSSGARDSS